MEWFKKLLGTSSGEIKSFEEETADLKGAEYRKLGLMSIEINKIVGSVDRAHELDSKFRYRNRSLTNRYHNVSKMMQEGRPMDPIKVIKVQRPHMEAEYYVVDGHHRVAEALSQGLRDINAHVTEVVIPTNSSGDAEKIDS